MARLCLLLACAAYAFVLPPTPKAATRREAVADLLPDDVVNSLSEEQLTVLYDAPDAVATCAASMNSRATAELPAPSVNRHWPVAGERKRPRERGNCPMAGSSQRPTQNEGARRTRSDG